MSITFQRSGYVERRTSVLMPPPMSCSQRDSDMVWEINMGVCPRLEFDKFMLFNCLGYCFYILREKNLAIYFGD